MLENVFVHLLCMVITFESLSRYSCLLGGISCVVLPVMCNGDDGVVDEKGLSLYSSDASVFQYSRQILKISVSSTSEIRSKY